MENDDVPITSYKGVMLCNRPNDTPFIPREKPYCSRVFPHEQIGLTLPKDKVTMPHENTKQTFPALMRHKKWLDEFKINHQIQKQSELEARFDEEEKFKKVRDIAKRDREKTRKMKEEYKKLSQQLQSEVFESNKKHIAPLTTENLKKLEEQPLEKRSILKHDKEQKKQKKPQWALTKDQIEENQEKEEEDLLNFMNNLDFDQYVNDMEVGIMLKALQDRVKEIQKEDNWREKVVKQIKSEEEGSIVSNKEIKKEPVDIYDTISQNLNQNEDGKSVASDKTINSINKIREQQQKQKQGKQDWDKSVTTDKQITVTLEDRIAKHVADEVLRNYKHLANVHSNQSIRRLLEAEAKRTMNKGSIEGPLISVVKPIDKTRSKIDPNNLPYLHRNPAI